MSGGGAVAGGGALGILAPLAAVGSGTINLAGSIKQANQLDAAAKREKLQGEQRATLIKERLAKTLATQRAAFASRGIGVLGTPLTIAEASTDEAKTDLDINSLNTDSNVSGLRDSRDQAILAGIGGLFGAASGAASKSNAIGSVPSYGTTPTDRNGFGPGGR
jgi:hypothetical protein